MTLIQPRTLRGFRDFLPEAMIPRERLMETARRVYRSFGFSPIDTPALEYLEILLGKGSDETDKQLYRFEDAGGRSVGMRFDLTIPLARFAAQHAGALGLPFKRYHLATVWRGENTQRGRYREFMQCDFDTIGTRSIAADIETALVVDKLFREIGFERFTIRANNRLVLNGLLEACDLADKSTLVLRALDKLSKIGRDKVIDEIMSTTGAAREKASSILKMAELSAGDEVVDPNSQLDELHKMVGGTEKGAQGVDQLRELFDACYRAGVSKERLQLDVSIARGLDYYTGTIFETFLGDLPGIGSVCSGGRYDNLAGLYTKQELPGIGASLGLDRLLAAMEELDMLGSTATPAAVLIPFFDKTRLADYMQLAMQLREAGLAVEVYPDPKKLGQQLKYADRKGFQVALVAGENEFADRKVQLKNLGTGEKEDISIASGVGDLVAKIGTILG